MSFFFSINKYSSNVSFHFKILVSLAAFCIWYIILLFQASNLMVVVVDVVEEVEEVDILVIRVSILMEDLTNVLTVLQHVLLARLIQFALHVIMGTIYLEILVFHVKVRVIHANFLQLLARLVQTDISKFTNKTLVSYALNLV